MNSKRYIVSRWAFIEPYQGRPGLTAIQQLNGAIEDGKIDARNIISIVHDGDGVARGIVVYYRYSPFTR